jgi:hypothetical protein
MKIYYTRELGSSRVSENIGEGPLYQNAQIVEFGFEKQLEFELSLTFRIPLPLGLLVYNADWSS